MNILFLSTANPIPPIDGHCIRTFNILKFLSRYHKIFFIAIARSSKELDYKDQLYDYCESVDIFINPINKSKLRFIISIIKNLFSSLPFMIQKYYHREISHKIKNVLEKHKIDIVHFDTLHLATYYNDVKKTPKVLTNHNAESSRLLTWIKIERNILIKLFLYYQYFKLKSFEQKMHPKFEECIVVSEDDKKVLLSNYKNNKNNISVIPNGVDIDYFRPSENSTKKNNLLWIGDMENPYSKDAVVFFIEKILPLIKPNIPDINVTFIGIHPPDQLIRASMRNANIKVLGFVDDVRPYMQECSIFIVPLRGGGGTKLKVLNSMALAKPVVTTSIGVEGIEVTPDENIVVADNPDEFADKIIYLLSNPDIAKNMGRKAREIVKKYYDWEVIGRKMNSLYNEISNLRS